MRPSDLQERLSGIATPTEGRHPLALFHDDLAVATMNGPENDEPMPVVETTRQVIEYLNRGPARLKAFDSVGYMVMQNVIVCELGKKDDVLESFDKSLNTLVQVVGGSSAPGSK